MHIGALNKRITFQRNTAVIDERGNHKNRWEDFYSCYATASKPGGTKQAGYEEGEAAPRVTEGMNFTVRYCSELAEVQPDTCRIVTDGRAWNVDSIDPMGFRKQSLKFNCTTEKRRE